MFTFWVLFQMNEATAHPNRDIMVYGCSCFKCDMVLLYDKGRNISKFKKYCTGCNCVIHFRIFVVNKLKKCKIKKSHCQYFLSIGTAKNTIELKLCVLHRPKDDLQETEKGEHL